MYQPLAPCTECRRHIRVVEARCPFCAAVAEAQSVEASPMARTSRAAAMVVAASMALAGCPSEAAAITQDPVAAKPSAPPPVPTPTPTLAPGEVDDLGAMVSKYGAPPIPKPPKPKPTP